MCNLADEYNYDAESPSVWRNTDVARARKPHRCDACGATIERGASYRSHVAIFDGATSTSKACAECVAVIDAFGEEHHALLCAGTIEDALHRCVEEQDDGWERWAEALRVIVARRCGPWIAMNVAEAYRPEGVPTASEPGGCHAARGGGA